MRRLLCAPTVIAGCWLVAGCGEAKKTAGTTPKDPLVELGDVLKTLATEKKRPPAKAAELEPVEPMLPLAGPQIRSGELVYLWGAGYAEGGTKVVAYEKNVPAEGGWVLLQDGTVKELSAAEFASAPKAK